MHRTQNLDYGVVLKGTAEMEFDNGPVTILKRGFLQSSETPAMSGGYQPRLNGGECFSFYKIASQLWLVG
ncbi:hypothetical protein A1O7_05044 [Cladophialophora yegresii CBS 114405]|uniref:Uncharacterized protein n=1 Tax=Cladophialophora yegresii CBS 114405 TaxID=1182544 RepID=W9W8N9_9EURO|nr:uncharacterized protein A1O7_05044 [Cladophialophora yegresii CBS 114405]EXJ60891.1 hypothetical protein A1O7_05044 [Cladophialophora yegresii CBS 114405]